MIKTNDFLAYISSEEGMLNLKNHLSETIFLKSVGTIPLSYSTDLRDCGQDLPFDSGELNIDLTSISAGHLYISKVSTTPLTDKHGRATVHIAPMKLEGSYRLFAIEKSDLLVDSGGDMMPLAEKSADTPSPADTKFAQLAEARLQRDSLRKTTHGQLLLNKYSKYNDIYNNAFKTNKQLAKHWQADGVTAQMAEHTRQSVSNGTDYINPDNAMFGNEDKKVCYNDNAFQQQTYLLSALLFEPDAAAATTDFATSVSKNTKNTQKNTEKMKRDDIYSAVQNANPSSKSARPAAHHESMLKVAKNEHSADDISLLKSAGYHMHDHQIKAMQEIHQETVRLSSPNSQANLWQGKVTANIPESIFTFSFRSNENNAISAHSEGNTLTLVDLEIDADDWNGQAGKTARKRLADAHFLRGLLAARLADYIERAVSETVFKYNN